jgi:hypothetical protein
MPREQRSRWQLGSLLPLLLGVALLLELASRWVPLDWVAFRTWEPALGAGGAGPFQPRTHVAKRDAYGDLASAGNVRTLRQLHDEELQADAFGFRNPDDAETAHFGGLVVGDSFTVASAVAEPDTLSGALQRRTGVRYYNAGQLAPLGPDDVAALAAALRIERGVVVLQLLERKLRESPPEQIDQRPARYEPRRPPPRGLWDRLVDPPEESEAGSPLRILCRRVVRLVEDDRLRPNPQAKFVSRRRLQNGEDMLFALSDEASSLDDPAITEAWVRYLRWYEAKLATQRLTLVVLLVPNKLTVYHPLVEEHRPDGAPLLARVAAALGAVGAPVVDTTSLLQRRAAELLPKRQYVYWRDDTHWNEAGIAIAADLLVARAEVGAR